MVLLGYESCCTSAMFRNEVAVDSILCANYKRVQVNGGCGLVVGVVRMCVVVLGYASCCVSAMFRKTTELRW